MKILFYSPAFYPSVGGLEAVVAMLAEDLAVRGCEVKVVTTTSGDNDIPNTTYEVVRSPSARDLLALVRWCDVFFHHNVSLKGLWPLLLLNRPWVVAHHGWYTRANGTLGWQDIIKRFSVRFATNIAVSRAVADHLPATCTVIPNPYRDELFRRVSGVARERDLVFLGRLVSDKGCDLLLDALALLRHEGINPSVTIVGAGPEAETLRAQCRNLGLEEQVTFTGQVVGEELVLLLNRHRIMVVPSRWNEPFGVVALEGIACGCAVIASSGGGLPEAVGSCGVTYPNGNVRALAERIRELLSNPERADELRAEAPRHLQAHQRTIVVQRYCAVLEKIMAARTAA